ncbi:MAG: invasion associated locus B family protein [Pseudomonadales bacterium]|jgi:invasion protein IalB|nr:invasion associated locus B family protein [Pseudomonadales bacterium]
MRSLRSILLGGWALALGLCLAQPGLAQGLPGGATSLRESHGDWTVACAVTSAEGNTSTACTLSQEQTVTSTGQRVLAIELLPAGQGAEGTLVLPFGLMLARGASLQVDEEAAITQVAFRTCLPIGCIVPLSIDAKMLAALRKGLALKIGVTGEGDAAVPLSVSLAGFSSAFDRVTALMR